MSADITTMMRTCKDGGAIAPYHSVLSELVEVTFRMEMLMSALKDSDAAR